MDVITLRQKVGVIGTDNDTIILRQTINLRSVCSNNDAVTLRQIVSDKGATLNRLIIRQRVVNV